MNETSNSPDSLFGFPFWMGYIVSSLGCCILAFRLHLLESHPGFRLSVLESCIAFCVVAPLAGLISQAAHDLLLAAARGQLRFRHFALLLAIVAACLGAGCINYLHGSGSTLWFPW